MIIYLNIHILVPSINISFYRCKNQNEVQWYHRDIATPTLFDAVTLTLYGVVILK
jgi:hypothetical protein